MATYTRLPGAVCDQQHSVTADLASYSPRCALGFMGRGPHLQGEQPAPLLINTDSHSKLQLQSAAYVSSERKAE